MMTYLLFFSKSPHPGIPKWSLLFPHFKLSFQWLSYLSLQHKFLFYAPNLFVQLVAGHLKGLLECQIQQGQHWAHHLLQICFSLGYFLSQIKVLARSPAAQAPKPLPPDLVPLKSSSLSCSPIGLFPGLLLWNSRSLFISSSHSIAMAAPLWSSSPYLWLLGQQCQPPSIPHASVIAFLHSCCTQCKPE